MIAPTPQQVAGWWRTLADHEQRYGRCPICDTRTRCWVRAGALADLIAHDVYYLGPVGVAVGESSGGNPTAGSKREPTCETA
ncbi:hypothetical protein [Micromonospora profundi]|uniref:hypothetical protein n=1 Tax=Micromonospora profundi TaxID=1420889 RepID=UPI003653148F